MIFLSPLVLAGFLALGMPPLIHLLSKPRLRKINWAATRFLIPSLEKNRRRLRIEDILLLLLRCLLIALLVIIFARPTLLTHHAQSAADQDVSTSVIILDNSASMGQSDGTRTSFEVARSIASTLVSKMGYGSSAALFLASNRVNRVLPQPTTDARILLRSLNEAKLTDEGSDLAPAIKAAVALLKPLPVRHRDVYIVTDSQTAAWRGLGQIREVQLANQRQIGLHVLNAGGGGENLAISGIQVTGVLAAVDQPLKCAVQVSNWGRNSVKGVLVKLAVDDAPPQEEVVIPQIDPGTPQATQFAVRFPTPGYHYLTATIPPDHLPADNQRCVALQVHDQMNALVVEGAVRTDSRDGYFLSHALAPVPREQVAKHFVRVTPGQPHDLENAALSHYKLIFLSNVGSLSPAGTQNLLRYVKGGGTLIVFPGPNTDVDFNNSQPEMSALIPATLGAARDAPGKDKILGWQSRGYEHPVTRLWNDPESGNLGGVRVSKYFPLRLKDAAHPGQIVVNYTNGEPAIVEQKVGEGRVFLFSSSATTDWTTLPVHPSFVPLLIRIISYATGDIGSGLNVVAGRPLACPVEPEFIGQTLSVQRPGDATRHPFGTVERNENSAWLRCNATDTAGFYRLFIGNDTIPRIAFAVQVDPSESNLAQEPQENLQPLMQPSGPAGDVNPEAPKTTAERRSLVPGRELWYPIALATTAILILETILAQRLSRIK